VISLCDKVQEVCAEFPDCPQLVHWSIPDPAATGDQDSYPAFHRTATEIDTRVRHPLPMLTSTPREEVQP